MERKRTLTMDWDGLADADDDDDQFFESYERISSAMPLDLASSDEEDDDFEDSRMSFASAVSSITVHHRTNDDFQNFAASAAGSLSPEYDVWMVAPSSISERRKRLLQEMGLSKEKELFSFKHPVSNNVDNNNINDNSNTEQKESHCKVGEENKKETAQSPMRTGQHDSPADDNSLVPVLLVRSRSEGDIESLSIDKKRKEEMIGSISKQRLTRTSSAVFAPHAKIYPYQESVRVAPKEAGNAGSGHHGGGLTLNLPSQSRLGAFFLIKNLDTGKEFIVNEYNEDGMWNRLSDLQTGKQLTMEEFEKSVGHSPVVKELMRRENVVSRINDHCRKFSANSYLSKSLRISKRRGAALLRNIKEVAHSMSLRGEKEREHNHQHHHQPMVAEQKQNKNSSNNKWVKVRHTGKSHKELSALYLCQEIQAHEGSIWTIKFSSNTRFLASAGEDRIIHVWEVQECEVTNMNEGNLTPLHSSLCNSHDKTGTMEGSPNPSEKKKKGKGSATPEYVHVPETVFSLSERPFCSFQGHQDDILDLSWSRSQLLLSSSMDKTVRLWDMESKSCLKLFAHNDYVTCIQFNPMDDDYFISGSLDAKVRIWSIRDRHVVDWTDLHEMVTAACYTPDGQNALIGSHKGSCRMYSIEDSKLVPKNQVDFQTKKKSNTKKITGFQFSPSNPSEVLVTSADSRIRILDGLEIVHKFRGFRNTSSQISAAFSTDGKYIISASEDSHVYMWKREEPRNATRGRRNLITTRTHEFFQCKDVSVAIPWHGKVKGEPPMPVHSKRHSRRNSSQPTSANGSPTKEETAAGLSKRMLPPLPKKNNKLERAQTPPEEDLAQVSRDPGIGESFNSSSNSIRVGDSPSMSGVSDSNSSSTRQDDQTSISAEKDKNSSSFPSWSSWFDGSNHSSHAVQTTAWGLVIVTATLGGEIRTYQNFGIPRRLGRL